MSESFNYERLLLKIIELYESTAESNGQEGDHDLYELEMAKAAKFREGLESFKENYSVRSYGCMSFLPEFFKILKTEYGCDIDELARYLLPAYISTKVAEKKQVEQELSNLEEFKTALETLKE